MSAKTQVGFVPFGFPSYPKDVMVAKAHDAAEAVRALGMEVAEADLLTGLDDVPRGLSQLVGKDYDAIVACVVAWTETPVVIGMLHDYLHLPILLWSLGGYTQDDRLVSLGAGAGASAIVEVLRQLEAKFEYVYDYPDSPMSIEKVSDFLRAATIVRILAHARMGMMGYADMGLYALMFDGLEVRKKIGVEVESYDMLEIERAMSALPDERVEQTIRDWQASWSFEQPVLDSTLDRVARLTLALGDKIEARGYLALSTKCVYGVTKYMGCTACLPQSVLGSKTHIVCENDVPGMITQTMLGLLTGQSTTFLELYEYFPDRLLTGVCGYVPQALIDGGQISVRSYSWGGSGAGMVNTGQMKEGRVTLARLAPRGDPYRMHIVTGVGLRPRSWEESGWAPPAPHFPSLEIVPDDGVESFVQGMLAQHYAVVYGDHRPAIERLCRLMGIQVI
jgi:L-fucose isomerase-like protein